LTRIKIVEYHMARLQDKQAATRLDAIKELLLLEATDALEILQKVYQEDEDEEVKRSAQNAGRELFKIRLKNSTS